MQPIRLAIVLSLFALAAAAHAAEVTNPPDKLESAATIAPGTVITATNWRDYEKFMPEGMVALFAGKFYWKLPADLHGDRTDSDRFPPEELSRHNREVCRSE